MTGAEGWAGHIGERRERSEKEMFHCINEFGGVREI